MKISHTSGHGVIVDLEQDQGFRLVTKNGRVGPVLRSPEAVAQKTPYTEWNINDKRSKVDLDTWLAGHKLSRADLTKDL